MKTKLMLNYDLAVTPRQSPLREISGPAQTSFPALCGRSSATEDAGARSSVVNTRFHVASDSSARQFTKSVEEMDSGDS